MQVTKLHVNKIGLRWERGNSDART